VLALGRDIHFNRRLPQEVDLCWREYHKLESNEVKSQICV